MKKIYSALVLSFGLLFASVGQAQNLDLEIKNRPLQNQVVPSRGVNIPFLSFEVTPKKDLLLKEILVRQTGLSSNNDVRSVRAEVAGNRSPLASVGNDRVARIQFVRGVDLYAGEVVSVKVTANLQTVSSRTIGFELLNIITEDMPVNTAFSQRKAVRRSIFDENNPTRRTDLQPTSTRRAETLNAREKLALLRQRLALLNTVTKNSDRRKAQSRAQGRMLLKSRRTGVSANRFSSNDANTLRGRSRSLDEFIATSKLRSSIITVATLDNGFDLPAGKLEKIIDFDLTNTEKAASRVNNLYFLNETGENLSSYFKGFELRNRADVRIAYTEDINEDRVRFYFDRGYRLQVNNSGAHSLWAIPKKPLTAQEVSLVVTGSD